MKVLGIRFCKVSKSGDAQGLSAMLGEKGLGLKAVEMPGADEAKGFQGAVFPVGDSRPGEGSWIEIWPAGPQMPEMTMLQIVVDDADKWAAQARENGLAVKGPDDAHGERIFYLEGPGGLPVAFLSKAA